MKQLKFTKVATLALAIAAGFGLSSTAQAGGLTAQSTLIVDSFKILVGSLLGPTASLELTDQLPSGVPTTFTSTTATIVDTAKGGVALTGNVTPPLQVNTNPGLGGVDMPQVCLGTCTLLANDFTPHFPFAASGTQYARVDSLLAGVPVDVPQFGIVTGGAFAATTADIQLTSSAAGHAQSRLDLNSSFNLTSATDVTVFLDFFATVFSFAAISADAAGTSANTSFGLTFTAQQIGPGGVLQGINAANGGGFFNPFGNSITNSSISGAGQSYDISIAKTKYDSGSFVLIGGKSYNFSIAHTVNADGTLLIPEPGSLALTGIALVGLFGARRKMKGA